MSFSRKPVFNPSSYDSRHRRKRMPRWLVILFTGIMIGSSGFWFIQTNYGPKRYTVAESKVFLQEAEQAKQEQQRLQSENAGLSAEITQLKKQLVEAGAKSTTIANTLSKTQLQLASLEDEKALLRQALAAGVSIDGVSLRSAVAKSSAGKLVYSLYLLKNERHKGIYPVSLEVGVSGVYPNGKSGYTQLPPVDVDVDSITKFDYTMALPNSLQAKNMTVRVKDKQSGAVLSRRSFSVGE